MLVPSSNRFIVDFLTVSFDRDELFTPEKLLKLFCGMTGLDKECFVKCETGAMTGYNRSYRYLDEKKISINWHETIQEQGVNINLTGQGCATIAEDDLHTFLNFAKSLDARFTRVDIALDDVTGIIPYDTITTAFVNSSEKRRFFSSRSQISTMQIYLHNNGDEPIYNVSLGSRQSIVRWRLYDKARERKLRDAYWRRLEFTLKYEHAEAVVDSILAGTVANHFAYLCNSYLRILTEPFCDKNVRSVNHFESAPIFSAFLQTLTNGQFDLVLPETCIFREKLKTLKDKYTSAKLIDIELLCRLNYYYHRCYGRFNYLRNTFPQFFADLDLEVDSFVITPKYRALERAIYNAIKHPPLELVVV